MTCAGLVSIILKGGGGMDNFSYHCFSFILHHPQLLLPLLKCCKIKNLKDIYLCIRFDPMQKVENNPTFWTFRYCLRGIRNPTERTNISIREHFLLDYSTVLKKISDSELIPWKILKTAFVHPKNYVIILHCLPLLVLQ